MATTPTAKNRGEQVYSRRVMQMPMLSYAEEVQLANAYASGDARAGDTIVTAHLRMAVKAANIASKQYGLPVDDFVGEASIGLMRALKRFDPAKGYRFETYARWWIKAAIREYALQNNSVVKSDTGGRRKSTVYGLKRMRTTLEASMGTHSPFEVTTRLAAKAGMSIGAVERLLTRVDSGDVSIDAPATDSEWTMGHRLVDNGQNPEEHVTDVLLREKREAFCKDAIGTLQGRQAEIMRRRVVAEDKETLDSISTDWGVSRERVRQIEVVALRKVSRLAHSQGARALV